MVTNLSLLVAAAFLTVSYATPCTDICFGTCQMTADGSMILMPFFEPMVELNLQACRGVCAATCNCMDTCQGSCSTALASCRNAPNMGIFKFFACQFEFATCGFICSTQCTLSTTAGVLDRMYKLLLPPATGTA
ncbi:hypothetical protein ElyMa_002749200 [Elysia marginata]|uniref:Uncharacterized protein n=1 Tax=Elysia marginata TaxID=1093978 RepID=A0AAV4HLL1_9GAST|nr:hypothetical protein ElyMa_002749200 [Elysia marginata]